MLVYLVKSVTYIPVYTNNDLKILENLSLWHKFQKKERERDERKKEKEKRKRKREKKFLK